MHKKRKGHVSSPPYCLESIVSVLSWCPSPGFQKMKILILRCENLISFQKSKRTKDCSDFRGVPQQTIYQMQERHAWKYLSHLQAYYQPFAGIVIETKPNRDTVTNACW